MQPDHMMSESSGTEGRGSSLSLRGLQKYYAHAGAVLGVDLEIEAGQFLTLLGPSGSGKTTTLMMIAGFVEPTAGEIRVNGASVTDLPPHKRDIGMVFQNYALFPHLTVADNVGFPLRMRGTPKRERAGRVAHFLELVGLTEFAKRFPQQLSGGQQQRVALARALVFSPSLVLMDEPLGALDRRLRLQMQEEIKSIQRRLGLTVVYVTHDQEEALTMSDLVAVMEGGRVSSFGTPRQIYERPQNAFVAGFIGESNFLSGMLAETSTERSIMRLASGESVLGAPSNCPQGQDCVMLIRPERLRLCMETDDVPNKTPAEILSETYLGDSSLYHVRLAGGDTVRVRRPNRGYGRPVAVGDKLFVGWQPRDGLILN
ncbi:MAG TPA: ABC transporter ATP-binding protein [Bryobacteraceae bacterium]|nr:ABC transporter ATP-binding protein [Bryobacteraceae bacterium]